MDNPDTDNTGYTMHITKGSENQKGNQEWTKQTPTTLGAQYTEQLLEKTEWPIKYEQSRHQQHLVRNTQNNG